MVGSFADARRKLKKEISSSTILRGMNSHILDGGEYFSMKVYLDQVAPDETERELRRQPEALGKMHAETAQMIADNLHFTASAALTDAEKGYLKQQGKAYKERLKRDCEAWTELIRNKHSTGHPSGDEYANQFARTGTYWGLQVQTKRGKVELTDFERGKVDNLRPNIRVQRQSAGGQFVMWETSAYGTAKLGQKKMGPQKRIYLNPKTGEHVRVFTRLMRSLDAAGITAAGKVLDRSAELAVQMSGPPEETVRADAIVLYVDEAGAEQAFQLVHQLYNDEPETFADRPTPKIPVKLAPGIAVGDEPQGEGESLTSHRAKVIMEAISKTRERLGIEWHRRVPAEKEQAAIDLFRNQVWPEVAKRNGVDPENLAFNL